MSTARGMGPSLNLQLREQHLEADGVEMLRDGFFWEAGTAAWNGTGVHSKVANTRVGSVALWAFRLDGAQWTYFRQGPPLVVGRTYRAKGWFRGDGVNGYATLTDFGALYYSGTTSTTWQWFDRTFVAAGVNVGFYQGGAPTGWIEVCEFSCEAVMMVTWDASEFQDTVAYLGSARGGAQECLSIVKLEHVDRHTGAVSTVADFSASPGAGAVYSLPTGWTYTCATAARTTQTSASTLVTGIAANQAPAKSVTGAAGSFGLSVEKATQQDINNTDFSTWVLTNATYAAAADPAGGAAAGRITDADPVNQGYATVNRTGSTVGPAYTSSCWVANATTAGNESRFYTTGSTMIAFRANPFVAWSRIAASGTMTLIAGAGLVTPSNVAVDTGRTDFYGPQCELGSYPTSLIPNTTNAPKVRAAATLTCPQDECNTHSGRIPRVTIRPHFAYNETTLDCTVVDDSRGHLFFEQSTQRFVFEVRGKGRIASLACTFSRDQEIVLRADLDEATGIATLIVSGCTTGNGTFQTYVAPQRKVTCGDGYTAASFPTQLGPSANLRKGVLTAAALNTNRLDAPDAQPLGSVGAVFVAVSFSTLTLGEAYTHVIAVQGTSTTYASGLLINQIGTTLAVYWGNAVAVISTANALTPGIHSIALVNDGSSIYMYLDGTLIGSAAAVRYSTVKGMSFAGDPAASFGSVHSTMVFAAEVFSFAVTAQQVKILDQQMRKEFST